MNRKQKKYMNTMAPLCMISYPTFYYSLFLTDVPFSKSAARNHLKHYGVTDKNTAKDLLEWFLTIGNRREFYVLQSSLLFLSENESHELISGEDEEGLKAKLSAVKKYMHRLNEHSIGALDLSNALFIAKHAKQNGLLTQEEAQYYELRAVRLAQTMYTSWREYLTACTAGAEFVQKSKDQQEKYLNAQKSTLIKLMASKHSPFRKIDFMTSFS
ncbi:DUF1266 domain-containing protein [Metabacillus sp. cB07]|uniref:DUF1266 domain-containing protein n=1 Tax=Metabacillus sp. cB07 TaxID=2806989 RepID=UPI00193ACE76|nr:DUF1266 domain-containing protein [Metabacillus sp. cB07]